MMQVLTILIWTGLEFLLLKGLSLIAPTLFTTVIGKLFPVAPKPPTP